MIRDLETSGLTEKEKALFRFVEKVNGCSPSITALDMEPLHAVGWDDDAIYYAITVCALFNFYNRWVDASGVHALSAHQHGNPLRQCQEDICLSTDGARVMIEIGTSWVAPGPLTEVWG